MKKQLNEVKRMQQLAGLITEAAYDPGASFYQGSISKENMENLKKIFPDVEVEYVQDQSDSFYGSLEVTSKAHGNDKDFKTKVEKYIDLPR